MSPHDDDLGAFDNDPILAALTGPGTDAELAGEAEALAAFRAVTPRRSRLRLVSRLGVGGAAISAAVVLSSGAAAAAYTTSLPRPVQNFVAHITNPLGVLAVPKSPDHSKTQAGPDNGGASASTATPTPTPAQTAPVVVSSTGSPKPTVSARPTTTPSHKPQPSPSKTPVPVSTPTATPTPTPTPTTTPTPTPTPTPTQTPPATGGSITISVGSTTVVPGGTVVIYGQVANADGSPVAGEQVWLLERQAGTTGVTQVANGTTGADGSVSLESPPLTQSVRLRLVTESKEKSASIGVALQPTIMATVAPQDTTAAIRVATTGAVAGDSVSIEQRIDGIWQSVATNELDSNGMALFAVTAPDRGSDRYRAVLPRSKAHAGAVTIFTVDAD